MRRDAGASGDEDLEEALSRVKDDWAKSPGERDMSARAEFRKIFRRELYLMGLATVLVVGMILALPLVTSSGLIGVLLVVWLIAFLGVGIALFVNWRCPVCGGYLGRGFWGIWSVSHCLRCGASLK